MCWQTFHLWYAHIFGILPLSLHDVIHFTVQLFWTLILVQSNHDTPLIMQLKNCVSCLLSLFFFSLQYTCIMDCIKTLQWFFLRCYSYSMNNVATVKAELFVNLCQNATVPSVFVWFELNQTIANVYYSIFWIYQKVLLCAVLKNRITFNLIENSLTYSWWKLTFTIFFKWNCKEIVSGLSVCFFR